MVRLGLMALTDCDAALAAQQRCIDRGNTRLAGAFEQTGKDRQADRLRGTARELAPVDDLI